MEINNTIKSNDLKEIGNKYFKPGHSFGGPCFPRDTLALSKYIRIYIVTPRSTGCNYYDSAKYHRQ